MSKSPFLIELKKEGYQLICMFILFKKKIARILCNIPLNVIYVCVASRHPGVDVAAAEEPGVRGDVPGRLHGAHDRLRLRRLPAQVPRDAVQPRQEPGQRLHRYVHDTNYSLT